MQVHRPRQLSDRPPPPPAVRQGTLPSPDDDHLASVSECPPTRRLQTDGITQMRQRERDAARTGGTGTAGDRLNGTWNSLHLAGRARAPRPHVWAVTRGRPGDHMALRIIDQILAYCKSKFIWSTMPKAILSEHMACRRRVSPELAEWPY
jgi:hypothetical protein